VAGLLQLAKPAGTLAPRTPFVVHTLSRLVLATKDFVFEANLVSRLLFQQTSLEASAMSMRVVGLAIQPLIDAHILCAMAS
jgi:hypothetical protein